MKEVLIFAGIFAVVLFGGYFAFVQIVTRLMHKWVETWNKVWGIDHKTSISALTLLAQELHSGERKIQLLHLKEWYHDAYWASCYEFDPMFPIRMRLRYELEDMLYAESKKEILYGDGSGEPLTGILNEGEKK